MKVVCLELKSGEKVIGRLIEDPDDKECIKGTTVRVNDGFLHWYKKEYICKKRPATKKEIEKLVADRL